jgi:hypothetical protein
MNQKLMITILIAAVILIAVSYAAVITINPTGKSNKPFPTPMVIKNEVSCKDTEGGMALYTNGSVTACDGTACITRTDFCTGKILTEYLCDKNKEITSVNASCPNGCAYGACIRPVPNSTA